MIDVDFEVPLDLKVSNLQNILNKYNSFKQVNRELKINSIIDQKKIELEIDDIRPEILGYLFNEGQIDSTAHPSLSNAVFIIKKIKIGIKDYNILYVKCSIEIIKTDLGKSLSSILDLNANLIRFRLNLSTGWDARHYDVPQVQSFYASC